MDRHIVGSVVVGASCSRSSSSKLKSFLEIISPGDFPCPLRRGETPSIRTSRRALLPRVALDHLVSGPAADPVPEDA